MRTVPSGPPIAYSISLGWKTKLEGPAKNGERRGACAAPCVFRGTVNRLKIEGLSTGGRECTIMLCGREAEVMAEVLGIQVSLNSDLDVTGTHEANTAALGCTAKLAKAFPCGCHFFPDNPTPSRSLKSHNRTSPSTLSLQISTLLNPNHDIRDAPRSHNRLVPPTLPVHTLNPTLVTMPVPDHRCMSSNTFVVQTQPPIRRRRQKRVGTFRIKCNRRYAGVHLCEDLLHSPRNYRHVSAELGTGKRRTHSEAQLLERIPYSNNSRITTASKQATLLLPIADQT